MPRLTMSTIHICPQPALKGGAPPAFPGKSIALPAMCSACPLSYADGGAVAVARRVPLLCIPPLAYADGGAVAVARLVPLLCIPPLAYADGGAVAVARRVLRFSLTW